MEWRSSIPVISMAHIATKCLWGRYTLPAFMSHGLARYESHLWIFTLNLQIPNLAMSILSQPPSLTTFENASLKLSFISELVINNQLSDCVFLCSSAVDGTLECRWSLTYSTPLFYLQNLSFLFSTAACLSQHSYNCWCHIQWCGRHWRICLGRTSNWQPSSETSGLMASIKSEVMLRMSARLVRIVWSAWAWTTLICFISTGWIPRCPLRLRYPQHLPVGLFIYACLLPSYAGSSPLKGSSSLRAKRLFIYACLRCRRSRPLINRQPSSIFSVCTVTFNLKDECCMSHLSYLPKFLTISHYFHSKCARCALLRACHLVLLSPLSTSGSNLRSKRLFIYACLSTMPRNKPGALH